MLASLALEDDVVKEQMLPCYESIDLDLLKSSKELPLAIKADECDMLVCAASS